MGPNRVSSPSSPAHTTWAWAEGEGSFLPTCFTSKAKRAQGSSQSLSSVQSRVHRQLVVGGLCFPLGFPLPHPGLNETVSG